MTTHLYVAAVMAPGRELDPAEGDGALQGHLDGRLLHAVLPTEGRAAGRGSHAAEIALDCRGGGMGS